MARSAKERLVPLAVTDNGGEDEERARAENEGSRLGIFLLLLGWEFEEDRDSLVELSSRRST